MTIAWRLPITTIDNINVTLEYFDPNIRTSGEWVLCHTAPASDYADRDDNCLLELLVLESVMIQVRGMGV